jgi:hypothetical protein
MNIYNETNAYSIINFTRSTKNLILNPTGGNVGIGTTSPSYLLDVQTASGENYIRVSSALNQDGGFRIAEAGTNKWLLYNVAASDAFAIYDNASVAERLRISSAGNLLIGTSTDAGYKLDVNGTGRFSGQLSMAYSGNPRLLLQDIDSGAGNVGILFRENTSDKWTLASVGGNFQFFNEATLSNAIYITSSNNVGIGTTTPNSMLSVYNTSSTIGRIGRFLQANSGVSTIGSLQAVNAADGGSALDAGHWAASSNNWAFRTYSNVSRSENDNVNSTGSIFLLGVRADGNVGIGTTSPNAPLDVASSTTSSSGVQQWSYKSSPASYRLQLNTIVSSGLVKWSYDLLNAGASYNNNLVLDRGNVGIGTPSPNNKLTVVGDIESLYTTSASTTNYIRIGTYAGGVYGSYVGSTSNYAGTINTNLLFGTTNGSGLAERMRITYDGNVGIGTTGPSKRLEVSEDNSSTTTTTGLKITNWSGTTNTRSGIVFQNYDNNGAAIWSRRTGSILGELIFGTNGGAGTAETNIIERMRITSGGNVGIGTTSPARTLSVVNTAEQLRIAYDTSGSVYTDFRNDSAGGLLVNTSGGYIIHYIAGSPIMRMNANGNVLIGTTTDSGAKLKVSGGIIDFAGDTRYGVARVYTASTGDMFGMEQVGSTQTGSGAATRLFAAPGGTNYLSLGWYTTATAFTDALKISASTGAATFMSSVTATSFFESSDKTIKTLIQDNYQAKGIESIVAKLYTKNGKEELGYFAQDLQEILPSAVSKGTDGLLSLSYREVHTAKIARLEKRVAELEQQLNLN